MGAWDSDARWKTFQADRSYMSSKKGKTQIDVN
jgi:hypothetical protein